MERRLTTILAADIVGYSRLMGEDEAGTLTAVKSLRQELVKPKASQYRGRTVKLMGDGVLMEFSSVVDAVQFAVELQVALAKRNVDVPEDQRIVYRVGINIGDIIVEGDDIYGDGVNIAARLEELCEPGGAYIARSVFNQVQGKLDLTFEHLGEKEVKNIAKPVSVYRINLDDKAAALVTPVVWKPVEPRRRWALLATAAAAAVPVLAVGGALWWQSRAPDVEPASIARMAFPLPDKPSIAVLPFDNLGRDPDQSYFADGMTDDLITDLSKISGLFVIARNSVFTYKGKAVKLRQVAEELGVRYVLEGSVRRVGDQVRINAQLVDTSTGGHLWAERYDGRLTKVFALQDEVTANIVSALAVELTTTESERLAERQTWDAAAYDAYLQGLTHFRAFTQEDFAKAEIHLLRAIDIDPDYGQAHAALAAVYWNSILRAWRHNLGWSDARARAVRHLDLAMKKPTPLAHRLNSRLLLHARKHDEAIAAVERAIALDPNDADSFALMGHQFIFIGRPAEGVTLLRKAMRLDPRYPALYLQRLGYAYFGMEQYTNAVTMFERARKRNPGLSAWMLVAAYGHLGQVQAAKDALVT